MATNYYKADADLAASRLIAGVSNPNGKQLNDQLRGDDGQTLNPETLLAASISLALLAAYQQGQSDGS